MIVLEEKYSGSDAGGSDWGNRPPCRSMCTMPSDTSNRWLAKQRAAGAAVLGGQ